MLYEVITIAVDISGGRHRKSKEVEVRLASKGEIGNGVRARPAVVVTTSGTAAANLLPAVVEASQSEVPLVLLTADRPRRLP